MSIEKNIAARRVVASLVELAGDELTREAWAVLRDLAIERVGSGVPEAETCVDPMDDAEAIRFERVPMPWGVYRGCGVGEVSTAYLIAITESPFNCELRRYLASKVFRLRQDEGEG